MDNKLEDKNYELTNEETELITALLLDIDTELSKLYFNKENKTFLSPFSNSNNVYINDVFKVQSYDFCLSFENHSLVPNFQYKDLEVYWYKYLGRGMLCYANEKHDLDYYCQMLKECKESIQKEFNKNRK